MNNIICVAVIFALLIGSIIGFELNKPKPAPKAVPPIEEMKLRYYRYDENDKLVCDELLVDTIYGDTMADLSYDTHVKDVRFEISRDNKTFNVFYRENGEDTLLSYEGIPIKYYIKWERLGQGKSPFFR